MVNKLIAPAHQVFKGNNNKTYVPNDKKKRATPREEESSLDFSELLDIAISNLNQKPPDVNNNNNSKEAEHG